MAEDPKGAGRRAAMVRKQLPTARKKLTFDELLKQVLADPRFRQAPKSAFGFVIGPRDPHAGEDDLKE